MKRHITAFLAAMAMLLSMLPITAVAAYSPPTSFLAPKGLGVTLASMQDTLDNFTGFEVTSSLPDDIRQLANDERDENSAFRQAGYYNLFVKMQLDFKVDSGSWHYDSSWDASEKANNQDFSVGIGTDAYTSSVNFNRDEHFEVFYPGVAPTTKSYFQNHTWTFRTRYVVQYTGSAGEAYYMSPWSSQVTYPTDVLSAAALINHAPVLKTADLKKNADGSPYLYLTMDKSHADLEKLSAVSGNWVELDIWVKVGNGAWKSVGNGGERGLRESFNFDASSYFNDTSYDAGVYDIRVRYAFDQSNYPQAGKQGIIYSPYSNVISKGMDAWSNASQWATPELQKANDLGLIPDILKGADMTKPISREEFAELSVLLYEKVTGQASVAASPNPFTDTANPQILKAFSLGITTGATPTTFSPNILINREQCATMLFRAIKAIKPDGNYSIDGVKSFPDQKYISSWAVEATKYMFKIGIIGGDAQGNFMPKATTTAQEATGYGMAAREQAIAITVRTYEKFTAVT